MDDGVKEDRATGGDLRAMKDGFLGPGLDPTHKVFAFILPGVEVSMTLVIPSQPAGLTGGQNRADKRPFIAFAVGKEGFGRDGVVEVESKVNLGLLDALAVVLPDLIHSPPWVRGLG
jgi:hypothetical protein